MRRPYKFPQNKYKNDNDSLLSAEKNPKSKWSFEEMVRLRELYPNTTLSRDELAQLFPDKTIQQVYAKASYMGLSRTNYAAAEAERIMLRRSDSTVTFAPSSPPVGGIEDGSCALSVADEPRTDTDRLRRNRVTRQVKTPVDLCYAHDSPRGERPSHNALGLHARESPAGRHDETVKVSDYMAKGTTTTLELHAHVRTPPKLKHTDLGEIY